MNDAKILLKKYPDRIPLIIKAGNNATPIIDKVKYLVPKTMKVSEFMVILRKKSKLTPKQAIFMFVNNVLPPSSSTFSELYHDHCDPDGFLYMMYALENTFGTI